MSRIQRSAALIALALALATIVPAPGLGVSAARAQAEDRGSADALDKARAHFELAEGLFASGRFDAAVVEYQAAYAAAPLPDFLFNIGQCYRNLRRWDEAIFSFEKYLELKPDAADRAEVEVTIAQLSRERDRAAAARIGLEATPPPAPRQAGPAATAEPRSRRSRPFYRRWWFFAAVGVATAATATVVYVNVAGDDLPRSDLGVLDFSK